MIQMETFLKISDNSGGKIAKCIHVYGNRKGNIGDKILVSIQKIKNKKKLSKFKIKVENHVLYKALIIQTKRGIIRNDGSNIKFNENKIVLLTKTNEKLVSTRILSPLLKELRNKKYIKFLTLSSKIL